MKATDRQSGVALITVMVIVAIVAGIGANLLRNHQFDIRRAENVLYGDQAVSHLLAAETWAREVLIQDRQNGEIDHLEEEWSKSLLPVETDGGVLTGRIIDQQGLFNLNNLIAPEGGADGVAIEQFARLIAMVAEQSGDPRAIAEAAADWVDSDQESTGLGGAEDSDYAVLDPAYRTPNRPMVSPSELLLVRGMSWDIWDKLRHLVTTLPVTPGNPTRVNVNTAPAEVIHGLTGVEPDVAIDIVKEREAEPFEDLTRFRDRIEASLGTQQAAEIDFDRFTTKSDFFLVESEARFGEVTLAMRNLIRRSDLSTEVLVRALSNNW